MSPWKVLTALVAARAAYVAVREPSRFAHNVAGHPLLVLCPPVGEWIHDKTDG